MVSICRAVRIVGLCWQEAVVDSSVATGVFSIFPCQRVRRAFVCVQAREEIEKKDFERIAVEGAVRSSTRKSPPKTYVSSLFSRERVSYSFLEESGAKAAVRVTDT